MSNDKEIKKMLSTCGEFSSFEDYCKHLEDSLEDTKPTEDNE